ncbi:hypothetical protein [Pseudomonas sp. NFX224]|uniref:hypothetical protein n=1 Tax=Pseudomonas sp. NFX224 TaxID=3402862 RepID=UPI003AFA7B8B
MDIVEGKWFEYTKDGDGNLVYKGRVIPQVLADRVYGEYVLEGDEEKTVEVNLREVYFDLWDNKENCFFLTAIDEELGLKVQVVGKGLAAGITHQITGEWPEASAMFRLRGLADEYNRSTEALGEIFFRFVENYGKVARVEGNFRFSLNFAKAGEDFTLKVTFRCNNFSVESKNYQELH